MRSRSSLKFQMIVGLSDEDEKEENFMKKIIWGETQVWIVDDPDEWQYLLEEALELPEGTRLLVDIENLPRLEIGQLVSFLNLVDDSKRRGVQMGLVDPEAKTWMMLQALGLEDTAPIFASAEMATFLS